MYTMHLPSKKVPASEACLRFVCLSDSRLKTRTFKQTTNVMVQSSQIEGALSWPTVQRRTSDSRTEDLVSEHLCVRRIFTDLLAMLESRERPEPRMHVLAEPSRGQCEETEQAVDRREADTPPPRCTGIQKDFETRCADLEDRRCSSTRKPAPQSR